ncbi:hypothetical protein ATANTOWER_028354 [Ataeniobius toweri]|uniref:Uncharacterized protein n=1 Tax=Ataeniobius toweri TaxID=208326 RepID=A0ABU7CAM0_9TELE|nr:hypothetical protein [Ataeniobius toweri]
MCVFYAFCQYLSCSFCDSSAFHVVRNDGDNPILHLVKAIARDGVTPKIYSQRAELLSAMFKKHPVEVWCPLNPCPVQYLHGHWKNNDKCIKHLPIKTLLFTVLPAKQRNNKGSTICFS